jgi:hypothetical protein
MEAEVDSQVAAPANENAQLAPSEKSLLKERGWKDGDRGGLAQSKVTNQNQGTEKTFLTHTGLLMEGVE